MCARLSRRVGVAVAVAATRRHNERDCVWVPLAAVATPTSPLSLRCPLTPCAAAVTLHFYFASLHRSTQYALGTKPMAWTGSAPAPASAPALTLPPSPLPLPLAQRCLWLSSASGARCTN